MTGEPETLKNEGTDMPTDVTVPPPSDTHSRAVAPEFKPSRLLALPEYEGNKFSMPAAAVAAPVPPFATGNTPVASLTGTLVAYVRLMTEGVPKLADVNKPSTVTCLVIPP